jgi:hypothetical protein
MKIKPKKDCKSCHGSGEVTDFVPYGSTMAGMDSFCDCVEEQIPEDFDGEIEIDLEDYRDSV